MLKEEMEDLFVSLMEFDTAARDSILFRLFGYCLEELTTNPNNSIPFFFVKLIKEEVEEKKKIRYVE